MAHATCTESEDSDIKEHRELPDIRIQTLHPVEPLVFFSVETTGGNFHAKTCEAAEVIQIAAVCGQKHFNVYLATDKDINKYALSANLIEKNGGWEHGAIKMERLSPEIALNKFLEFLKDIQRTFNRKLVLATFGQIFHANFLMAELIRNGLVTEEWGELAGTVSGFLDISKMVKEVENRKKNPSFLNTINKYLSVDDRYKFCRSNSLSKSIHWQRLHKTLVEGARKMHTRDYTTHLRAFRSRFYELCGNIPVRQNYRYIAQRRLQLCRYTTFDINRFVEDALQRADSTFLIGTDFTKITNFNKIAAYFQRSRLTLQIFFHKHMEVSYVVSEDSLQGPLDFTPNELHNLLCIFVTLYVKCSNCDSLDTVFVLSGTVTNVCLFCAHTFANKTRVLFDEITYDMEMHYNEKRIARTGGDICDFSVIRIQNLKEKLKQVVDVKNGEYSKWTVSECLGYGHFAKVFLARHSTSGELAAIKVHNSKLFAMNEDDREKPDKPYFYREIIACTDGKLNHLNIIRYDEFWLEEIHNDLTLYLKMEYCPFTLNKLIQIRNSKIVKRIKEKGSAGPVSILSSKQELEYESVYLSKRVEFVDLQEAGFIFAQICDGLHILHRHLLVHGDLRTVNILVTKDNIVKLSDFGEMKHIADDTTSKPAETLLLHRNEDINDLSQVLQDITMIAEATYEDCESAVTINDILRLIDKMQTPHADSQPSIQSVRNRNRKLFANWNILHEDVQRSYLLFNFKTSIVDFRANNDLEEVRELLRIITSSAKIESVTRVGDPALRVRPLCVLFTTVLQREMDERLRHFRRDDIFVTPCKPRRVLTAICKNAIKNGINVTFGDFFASAE